MRPFDAHAHFFSRPFFEALAAQSPQPGSVPEKLARLSAKTGIELPHADPNAHARTWIASLDAAGIEGMAAFASLPEEVPAVAEAVRGAPDRLVGVALVNPRAEGAAARTAELLAGGAFRGALFFPAMHHFHVGGPEARDTLAALAAHRGVCYVHCGLLVVKLRDLLGLPRPYDLSFANPLDVVPAANAFPEVTFVVPHFGAGFFRETLMAGAQCENVVVDTSSTNSWTRTQPQPTTLRDAFARALDVFGPERVLFGTDSNVFPAGWRAERLEQQRAILDDLGLPRTEIELVLGGNARRVLRRETAAAPA